MGKKSVILIVDDNREYADEMAGALKLDMETITVYSSKDALNILQNQKVNVVVTDMKLGNDASGLDILEEAKKHDANIKVILVTAYATIDTCKEAIKQGVCDYLVKPVDIEKFRTLVQQVCKKDVASSTLQQEDTRSKNKFMFDGVKGKSLAMQKVFEVLQRVSPKNIPVLLEGPTGTGKGLLARAIHNNSEQKNEPFKSIKCSGITKTFLERELFGQNACSDPKRIFGVTGKCTLFLDDIGEMPLPMQSKMLRLLKDGFIVPVTSSKQMKIDVRVISATSQNLAKLIEEEEFREDLYSEIKGVRILVLNLHERREDIPDFIDYFIKVSNEKGSNIKSITESAKNILVNYNWPGNIPQLRNCIDLMVATCEKDVLDVADIPPDIQRIQRPKDGEHTTVGLSGVLPKEEREKKAIIETLAKTGNNREKAAKILGIGERTIYRKIKKYNL